MVPRPDFFIPGAPKSGTSSMYEYLRQHPEIYFPSLKEPRYFATDQDSGFARDGAFFVRTEEEYLALYRGVRAERRIGDASVQYLSSRAAPDRIRAFSPDARFIVMLRDPVEMAHALHGQRLAGGGEDIEDFEAALEAEEERRQGRRLPRVPFHIHGLLYREVARYGEQLERWFGVFPRDRFLIILFEEFLADIPATYRQTLEFLDVDPTFRPETFDVVNPARRARSTALQNLLRSPTKHRLAKRFLPDPVVAGLRPLLRPLYRMNAKVQPRGELSPELRGRLEQEFAPDVERLSGLLDRDLASLWFRRSNSPLGDQRGKGPGLIPQ